MASNSHRDSVGLLRQPGGICYDRQRSFQENVFNWLISMSAVVVASIPVVSSLQVPTDADFPLSIQGNGLILTVESALIFVCYLCFISTVEEKCDATNRRPLNYRTIGANAVRHATDVVVMPFRFFVESPTGDLSLVQDRDRREGDNGSTRGVKVRLKTNKSNTTNQLVTVEVQLSITNELLRPITRKDDTLSPTDDGVATGIQLSPV